MTGFKKAVKFEAKGRAALIGPAGSGKSFTMLIMARLLAGPTGRIAAIDTEHGSLSKYADIFDFDVIELSSFSPGNFLSSLKLAEKEKYDVFCCDSLSHFWVGKDGALEFVDTALLKAKAKANGRADDMAGWKEFRPHEREMVDAMIASSCHILCTMRTKNAYEMQTGSDGRKRRVKIGLSPVQREGLEYEFDFVGMMDDENTLIVDKTRCTVYAGKALSKPRADDFLLFRDWLAGAARTEQPKAEAPPKADLGTVTITGEIEKAAKTQQGWWFEISGGIKLLAPLSVNCDDLRGRNGWEATVKAYECLSPSNHTYYKLHEIVSVQELAKQEHTA